MTTASDSTGSKSVHRVQGKDVVMPVQIRDARVWAAQFLVPASSARAVLSSAGLQPVVPIKGKAVCALGFVDYIDGDLGQYHEFMVALMAKVPGRPKSLGAFIHWLPVDQTFTCEAGRSIWGFPKEMSDITVTRERGHTAGEVRLDGQLVLRLEVGAGLPAPAFLGGRSIAAYTFGDEVLRSTAWEMQVGGVRGRPGGARVVWGDHPKAQELRGLGIPDRGIVSSSVARLKMTFNDAVPVASSV
jgi:hypothetical protein